MRIKLDQILMPENVPAGMNPLVLMSLAYQLRSSNEPVPPIKVKHGGDSIYQIIDGKHRFVAHMIAGRMDIEAEVRHR